MNPVRGRRLLWVVVAAALVTLAAGEAVFGCSKKSSPTSPGGGGGGTAPAPFDLHFTAQGVSQQLTFPNASTFGYHCTPHQSAGMTGTVTVSSAGTDSALVSVGFNNLNQFNPASVTIKANGHVRWVNVSTSTNHTVTSN